MAATAVRTPENVRGVMPTEVDWIVCFGRDREFNDGRVTCPIPGTNGRIVQLDVEACLACRHLEASSFDRLPAGVCSAFGAP